MKQTVRERDPIQCMRDMHPIASVFVLELVRVKDKTVSLRQLQCACEREHGARRKERGEPKWTLSNLGGHLGGL